MHEQIQRRVALVTNGGASPPRLIQAMLATFSRLQIALRSGSLRRNAEVEVNVEVEVAVEVGVEAIVELEV